MHYCGGYSPMWRIILRTVVVYDASVEVILHFCVENHILWRVILRIVVVHDVCVVVFSVLWWIITDGVYYFAYCSGL